MMTRISTAALALALAAGPAVLAAAPAIGPRAVTITRDLPGIHRAVEQTLELPAAPGAPFSVDLDLDGVVHRVHLQPYSLRSADFMLLMADADGNLQPVTPPAPRTYRGHVEGQPFSHVSASLLDDGLHAYIEVNPTDMAFNVMPLGALGVAAPPGRHASYRRDEADRTPILCPVGAAQDVEEESQSGSESSALAGTGFKICEIAFDIDWTFVSTFHGGNAGAALSDVEGVMNTTEFVYERDIDVTYEITYVVIRTGATDPYTTNDAEDLLCQLRNEWNSNPLSFARRDVVQLVTGRSLIPPPIGIAWNGVICNVVANSSCGGNQNLAYSLVESRFSANPDQRVALHAHELGHNWNAPHCDGAGECNIMCSVVDQCDGSVGPNLKFAPVSQNSMINFRNSRTCLGDLPPPLTVPFLDTFPDASLDTDNWIWSLSTGIQAGNGTEPSPPNVMRLSSLGAADFRDGEVRSNFMLLEGQSDLKLKYWLSHTGVTAGEFLAVDVWTDNLAWVNLNTYFAPGIDLPFYIEFIHDLPLSAYHDEFRVRFRQEADSVLDNFQIDDVFVGSDALPCPGDVDGDGDVGFLDLLGVLSAWGPCASCPEDIDMDGTVGFNDLLIVLAAWGPCP